MTSPWNLDQVATATDAPPQPTLEVVDAHHHFWGEGHFGATKFGVFLPDDFVATVEASGHTMAASVYVDCGWAFRTSGPDHLRCVGETEFVEDAANRLDTKCVAYCGGIVGQADLMLGDRVAEVLEAHLAASPTRFRGIRELVGHDPDAYQALRIPRGKAADRQFRAGFSRLAHLGLSCDLLCTHTMLADVADLARAFPETTIVIDHLGSPIGIGRFAGDREAAFADWQVRIADLAHYPNVAMKISGIGSEVMGFGWQEREGRVPPSEIAQAIAPYVGSVVDAFTPSRCMFGSNFPVDRQSFAYGAMWDAFKAIIARYSPSEQSELLKGTAARVYRLDLDR